MKEQISLPIIEPSKKEPSTGVIFTSATFAAGVALGAGVSLYRSHFWEDERVKKRVASFLEEHKTATIASAITAAAAATAYSTRFWEDHSMDGLEGIFPANKYLGRTTEFIRNNLVFESFDIDDPENYVSEVQRLRNEEGYTVVFAPRHETHIDHEVLKEFTLRKGFDPLVLYAGNTMMWHPLRHLQNKILVMQPIPKSEAKKDPAKLRTINRVNLQAFRLGRAVAKRGASLGIYLEGGREKDASELLRFVGDGMQFADVAQDEETKESKVIVLPLIFEGAREVMPPNTWMLHKSAIKVRVLEPFFLRDLKKIPAIPNPDPEKRDLVSSRQVQADVIALRIANAIPEEERGAYRDRSEFQETIENARQLGIIV